MTDAEFRDIECRRPSRFNPARLKPSKAHPIQCSGCGYCFASVGKWRDHKRAFVDV